MFYFDYYIESFRNFIRYICLSYYFVFNTQKEMFSTKPGTEKPTTTENNISLGKRKISEPEGNRDGTDDFDLVILSPPPSKKFPKVTLSNTVARGSVAKLERQVILEESFAQTKIACGDGHTITLSDDGTLHSFGFGSYGNNEFGQCGLGHFDSPQIAPNLILNSPSNIVRFVCGDYHNLFLDSEGNVFSVGNNYSGQLGLGYSRNQNESNEYGQLGLGHNTDQNELSKIPNIPPIKIISCVSSSSYLIDFEGNLWSFGKNNSGQLGHGDKTNISTPKIINTVKDIQQMCYGSSCADHFFAKNSQNQIFVTGNNDCGQLGTGDNTSVSIPKEINSKYFSIWGSNQHITKQRKGKCLETTTIINWQEEETKKIEMIQAKIEQVKLNLASNNNNKIKQEFPPKSFESWNEVHDFLNEKSKQIDSKLNEKQHFELQHEKDIQAYEMELKDIEHQLQQLQTESSEYSSSESGEYTDSDEESSDDEETVKERQQRIEQLHKDQELAAKRAKELQSKKAQTKPPVAKNEQGKI